MEIADLIKHSRQNIIRDETPVNERNVTSQGTCDAESHVLLIFEVAAWRRSQDQDKLRNDQ